MYTAKAPRASARRPRSADRRPKSDRKRAFRRTSGIGAADSSVASRQRTWRDRRTKVSRYSLSDNWSMDSNSRKPLPPQEIEPPTTAEAFGREGGSGDGTASMTLPAVPRQDPAASYFIQRAWRQLRQGWPSATGSHDDCQL